MKRVLARLLDGIIVWIVSLPLTFVPLKDVFAIYGDYFRAAMDEAMADNPSSAEASAQLDAQFMADLIPKMAAVTLTMLLVYMVYEITFLAMTGATLGKRAVGISVRLRDEPGPPPLLAILKRTFVNLGSGLIRGVPFVGIIASLFSLLNVLWPLWDDKKQALHDKAGATNVVVGRQPRRDG